MKRIHLFCLLILQLIFVQSAFGGDMEVFNLKNGIKVLFNRTNGVKVVSFKVMTPVSVINESKENSGVSNLLSKMMVQSTLNRSSEKLAQDIDNIGASLSSDTEYDIALLNINFLSEYFDKACELMADIVINPAFKEDELEFEKQNIVALLSTRKDSITRTAIDTFRKYYYDDFSYAYPVLGQEETLSKISSQDLIKWHKYSYNASNMIISIAGNIDKDTVKDSLEKYFGNIEKGEKADKNTFMHDPDTDGQIYKVKGKFNQAFIFVGFPAPDLKGDDFVNLKVISSILGGRMTSRLFIELREKLGLAYDVGALYPSMRNESFFGIYIGLDKKNIDLTLNRINEIIGEFCASEIEEQELKDVKTYIKGIYIMQRQTVGKQSYFYGWRECVGQGYKYDDKYLDDIEKVTVKDIYETANKIFKQKSITVIIDPDEK